MRNKFDTPYSTYKGFKEGKLKLGNFSLFKPQKEAQMIDQEGYLLEIEFRKLEKFVKSHKLYVLTIFCVGDELYHKILKIRKLEGCEVAPYPNKRDARKAANWYYRHNRNVILIIE